MSDIVLGALGFTAVFDSCINYFRYIQFGRDFKEDYQRCLLKVDVASLRLCRWAKVVNEHSGQPAKSIFSEADLHCITRIMSEIKSIFEEARALSESYQSSASRSSSNSCPSILNPDADLHPEIQQLHHDLSTLTFAETVETGLRNRTSWALWKRSHFEKLITDVTGLIDSLVALNPPRQSELENRCRNEVKSIGDEQNTVAVLINAASGMDPLLESALKERKDQNTKSWHAYRGNRASVEARVRYGDEYGANWTFGPIGHVNGHMYYGNSASDTARVQYGDSFGGRSVFD
ncbi:MAG: hypothetical protein Q9160_001683 [Pyrenula sp. 1 TL-2023]